MPSTTAIPREIRGRGDWRKCPGASLWIAGFSISPTKLPGWIGDPDPPKLAEPSSRTLGRRTVGKQPVEGRAGAADVGAKGTGREQLGGERRGCEIVGGQRREV